MNGSHTLYIYSLLVAWFECVNPVKEFGVKLTQSYPFSDIHYKIASVRVCFFSYNATTCFHYYNLALRRPFITIRRVKWIKHAQSFTLEAFDGGDIITNLYGIT